MAAKRNKEGLETLDQKGWIHEEKSAYLIEAARRYLSLTEFGSKVLTERGEPYVVAVAPTHAEIRAFTADVRVQMKEHGALSGAVIKRRAFVTYDSTRAAKRASQSYVPGLAVTVISEKTKVRGLVASQVYTVTKNPCRSEKHSVSSRNSAQRSPSFRPESQAMVSDNFRSLLCCDPLKFCDNISVPPLCVYFTAPSSRCHSFSCAALSAALRTRAN